MSKRHFPLISTVLARGEERRVSVCERERERERANLRRHKVT